MQITSLSSKPQNTEMFVITSHDFHVKMMYFFPQISAVTYVTDLQELLVLVKILFASNFYFTTRLEGIGFHQDEITID